MATRRNTAPPANKPAPTNELPTLSFVDQQAWETWLAKHQAESAGVWLQFAKKGTGVQSITYAEALEGALIWGWIDGQARRLDETFYLQRFTPRRPKSIWSKINRERAEALIAAGRMQPPGLVQVERAKADGRWDAAYDSPSKSQVPPDLQAALDGNAKAAKFFATLDAQNRYSILHRLQTHKRAETRAAKLAKFVEMLERGEKIHG